MHRYVATTHLSRPSVAIGPGQVSRPVPFKVNNFVLGILFLRDRSIIAVILFVVRLVKVNVSTPYVSTVWPSY